MNIYLWHIIYVSFYLGADHVESGYEVTWAVDQVATASHGRLVEVHGVRVLEARVARRLAVDGHQIVVQHGDDGLWFLVVRRKGRVRSYQKVEHAVFHLQECRVLALQERYRRRHTRHVRRKPPTEKYCFKSLQDIIVGILDLL